MYGTEPLCGTLQRAHLAFRIEITNNWPGQGLKALKSFSLYQFLIFFPTSETFSKEMYLQSTG